MRHKWKDVERKYIRDDVTGNIQYVIENAKECIHCGLLKGNAYHRKWCFLVYFKNETILSTNTLPYKCTEAPNSIFISEKDFSV